MILARGRTRTKAGHELGRELERRAGKLEELHEGREEKLAVVVVMVVVMERMRKKDKERKRVSKEKQK